VLRGRPCWSCSLAVWMRKFESRWTDLDFGEPNAGCGSMSDDLSTPASSFTCSRDVQMMLWLYGSFYLASFGAGGHGRSLVVLLDRVRARDETRRDVAGVEFAHCWPISTLPEDLLCPAPIILAISPMSSLVPLTVSMARQQSSTATSLRSCQH
jgi:hypothetical protein